MVLLNIFLGWLINGHLLMKELLNPWGLLFFEPFYEVEGVRYAVYDMTPEEFSYCKTNLTLYYRRRDPIEVILWLRYNFIPQWRNK
jgi:hypothetical protein